MAKSHADTADQIIRAILPGVSEKHLAERLRPIVLPIIERAMQDERARIFADKPKRGRKR